MLPMLVESVLLSIWVAPKYGRAAKEWLPIMVSILLSLLKLNTLPSSVDADIGLKKYSPDSIITLLLW